jgi:hypothetical protein
MLGFRVQGFPGFALHKNVFGTLSRDCAFRVVSGLLFYVVRLQQRHYAAVVYLNDKGTDFDGGSFLYKPTDQNGNKDAIPAEEEQPSQRSTTQSAVNIPISGQTGEGAVEVTPRAGRVVMYRASLPHCVEPVRCLASYWSHVKNLLSLWYPTE